KGNHKRRRFSQSEKRNLAAAEKLEFESEGGQKFLFPDPFPFCPPERKIKNPFQKKFELLNKNSLCLYCVALAK
ncbi:MAG TPA: hypothetical protein PKL86_00930, partial [Candidatus Portnoybacteria bacterium]|nr:hypothetical protein [Candidatus Portnoybacteria bacterium]